MIRRTLEKKALFLFFIKRSQESLIPDRKEVKIKVVNRNGIG